MKLRLNPLACHEVASAEVDRPKSRCTAVDVDDEPVSARPPRPLGSGSGSGSDRSGDIRLLLSLRISGCGGTGRKALKGSGSLSPERGDRDLDRVVRPLKDVVLVKAVGQEAVELEEKSRSAGATRRSATNAVAGVR